MNDFENLDIHEGRRERIRRRIMDGELDALHPHEVMEFLLYYIFPRQDVNDLAHSLLERFENLKGIWNAGYDELLEIEGLGETGALWIRQIAENIMHFQEIVENSSPELTNYHQVFSFARKIRHLYRPPCAVQLFLDENNSLNFHKDFCASPRWGTPETFHTALDDAISSDARDIIILIYTHQHTPVPSHYDISRTRTYAHLMYAANCSLLDVVLVGMRNICSLRHLGHIPDRDQSFSRRLLRENYLRGMPADEFFCVDDFDEQP